MIFCQFSWVSLLLLVFHIQTDFLMYGAPKDLRISWMFWGTTVNSPELYESTEKRSFKFDQPLLDYFNIKPSHVGHVYDA